MVKLENKALKEILKNISEVLNDYEQYEIENGDAWGYVLKLNKNKDIELRIMDEEWTDYVITIPSDVTRIKDILKGFINYLYENEINWRSNCLKSNKGWYARKHKSTNLWLERENETKVLEIAKEISERYKNSKLLKNQVEHFKVFISRFYYALNCLDKTWKIEDIKEATLKRLDEFNIKNVGISHIDNKLIIMKSNDDSTYIVDKFDIEIDSFTNTSMVVNTIVNRLAKVA